MIWALDWIRMRKEAEQQLSCTVADFLQIYCDSDCLKLLLLFYLLQWLTVILNFEWPWPVNWIRAMSLIKLVCGNISTTATKKKLRQSILLNLSKLVTHSQSIKCVAMTVHDYRVQVKTRKAASILLTRSYSSLRIGMQEDQLPWRL